MAKFKCAVTSLREIFAKADNPRVQDIASQWPSAPRATLPKPRALPVVSWMQMALANAPPATSGLVKTAFDLSEKLHWQQTYSDSDLSRFFLDRYGWSLLVGPDAPVRSTQVLSGFLLLGPDIEYPPHQHEAEEAYVVLSGTASWKLDSADWAPLQAGSVIYNPSWRVHGMRTDQAQPLLLAFLWKASATEKSRILS